MKKINEWMDGEDCDHCGVFAVMTHASLPVLAADEAPATKSQPTQAAMKPDNQGVHPFTQAAVNADVLG
ncbi:MAG: hypothetical protein AB1724_17700 [Thermodesulfobacteriota bacterium]